MPALTPRTPCCSPTRSSLLTLVREGKGGPRRRQRDQAAVAPQDQRSECPLSPNHEGEGERSWKGSGRIFILPHAAFGHPLLQAGEGTRPRGRTASIAATPAHRRAGLSLFEVVIALAVFLVSIAAIGQLVANGTRAALMARLQTQAVLRCESKLSEMVAGITGLQNASDISFSDDSAWTWSAKLQPGPQEDLYIVEVTVAHQSGGSLGQISYTLSRLIRDPEAALEAQAAQQQQQQSSSSSSSSSSGSSTSSSSSTGGSR